MDSRALTFPVAITSTLAALLGTLAGCGGGTSGDDQSSREWVMQHYVPKGAHHFKGHWKTNLDASRSIAVNLEGGYLITSNPKDAPAGKTDLFIQTGGSLDYRNTSGEGRSTEDTAVVIGLVIPGKPCAWRDKKIDEETGYGTRPYCYVPLAKASASGLEPNGDKSDTAIKEFKKLGSVPEGEADTIISAAQKDGVVIATASAWDSDRIADKPKPCGGGIEVLTFFSEQQGIDGCTPMK